MAGGADACAAGGVVKDAQGAREGRPGRGGERRYGGRTADSAGARDCQVLARR